MSGSRKLACLIAALAGWPAAAAPLSPVEQVHLFADCAGRYAALTEHLWMFDGAASEQTALRRDQFAELLTAALPDAIGVNDAQATGWRVAARAAQRNLLESAVFASDMDVRDRANRIAATAQALCDSLLPGT